MIEGYYPYDHDWQQHFESWERIEAGEGWATYHAFDKTGNKYKIDDSGTMADFVDDDDPVLQTMVRIYKLSP